MVTIETRILGLYEVLAAQLGEAKAALDALDGALEGAPTEARYVHVVARRIALRLVVTGLADVLHQFERAILEGDHIDELPPNIAELLK